MKSLSIILPLHIFNETVSKYLNTALKSVKELNTKDKPNVIFVGPKTVLEESKKLFEKLGLKNNLSLVENDETNFFKQVNKAVMSCTSKYFSVLEFDDYFSNKWINNVDEYLDADEKYSVYLPLTQSIDENGEKLVLQNEMAWASSFSDNLGFLDIESLETFMDFNVTGAIINTEDFISLGCLKPSLKITAWYEFLLRSCYNSKPVFVVPRVGYFHTIGRKDSFMVNSKNEISQEEGEWLVSTARQEYFFKEDRNKVFENNGGA